MMTEKQAWLYMADFYSKEHNQIKITYHSKTTNSQQTAYYYVYLWGNNWNVTDEDLYDSVYTGCYLRIGGMCSLLTCLIQQKSISRMVKDKMSAKIEDTLDSLLQKSCGKRSSAYLFDMTKEGHLLRVAYCTAQANEIKDTIYGLPSSSSSDTV